MTNTPTDNERIEALNDQIEELSIANTQQRAQMNLLHDTIVGRDARTEQLHFEREQCRAAKSVLMQGLAKLAKNAPALRPTLKALVASADTAAKRVKLSDCVVASTNGPKPQPKSVSDPCPDCGAELNDAPGGGVICSRACGYWFCF